MEEFQAAAFEETKDDDSTVTRKHGIITNFAMLNENGCKFIINDLKLKMNIAQFMRCVNYYGRVEHRNPSIDEIYLIDCIFTVTDKKPWTVAVDDFSTDDNFIFETFTDLYQKFTQLSENKAIPLTYSRLANTARDYLDAIGKKAKFPDNVFIDSAGKEYFAEAGCESCDIAQLSNIFYAIKADDKSNARLSALDNVVCFHVDSKENSNLLYDFIAKEKRRNIIKLAKAVTDGGIAYAVMSIFDGVSLDFTAITNFIKSIVLLDDICKAHDGIAFIARVDPTEIDALTKKASENGIAAAVIGVANKIGRLTIGSRDFPSMFSADMSFLKSFYLISATRYCPDREEIHLSESTYQNAITIGSFVINDKSKVLYACSCVEHSLTPFYSTIRSMLDSIGMLAEQGCTYQNVMFNGKFDFPEFNETEYNQKHLLSYILASYRIQAEFALVGENKCTFLQNKLPTYNLIFYSLASNDNISNELFANAEGDMYILSPIYHQDGLPDFAAIRGLLTYVDALLKKKAVKAIKYIGGICLSELFKNNGNVEISAFIELCQSVDFGFLIESDIQLNGKLIAKYKRMIE